MSIEEKDKEIGFLRDQNEKLHMQVSILQNKHARSPRYSLAERLHVLWFMEVYQIPRRSVTASSALHAPPMVAQDRRHHPYPIAASQPVALGLTSTAATYPSQRPTVASCVDVRDADRLTRGGRACLRVEQAIFNFGGPPRGQTGVGELLGCLGQHFSHVHAEARRCINGAPSLFPRFSGTAPIVLSGRWQATQTANMMGASTTVIKDFIGLHCHGMGRHPALTYGLLLTSGVLALPQCQTGDPEAAYLGGDFIEARKFYNSSECATLSGDESKVCNERAKQITEALTGAAQYLGRRANDRIRHYRQIQFNRYNEAIRSLELALKIMPVDGPSRPDFMAGLERIRKILASLENELSEHLRKLKAMLDAGTYDPEVWTDIRLTFERIRVLLLAIGRQDDRPQTLAREFVEKFRRHGQYEHARIATQLAEAVVAAGRPTRRHTDEELILFGVIDYLGQQQESARKKEIDGLFQEIVAALESKQSDVAIDKAHAMLRLGPKGRTARRVRAILAQLEGTSGRLERAKEARRVVAETPADIEPVPLAEPLTTAAADDDESVETVASTTQHTEESPVDRRSFRQRLKEIIRKYEEKKLYEALTGLEALYREPCSPRERQKVTRLSRIWTPDRLGLTADIVKEADRLFVLMDERSLVEYERAQRLRPEGETADHIKERIETLKRILSD
ncbi:hypothetical protein ACFL6C_07140 [Myxococcota bacterium]